MSRVEALLVAEASERAYVLQLDDSERLATIGVPFLMGREMLLANAHSHIPKQTSGPSADDVLSKLQEELAQLRSAAANERNLRDVQDEERASVWKAQNASMSSTILQLQDHVRSALDAYKTHAFTSASVAAAKAAEQAMERLQESQLAHTSGAGTISEDAKRLAKVEFAKMRADARDTALRHTIREERDARDFVEEIQFVVRREFLNLFQAGILKPLSRADIVPPVVAAHYMTLPTVDASPTRPSPAPARAPSFTDTLRREATEVQRGRRFVQYFHVLGYDVDASALYSSKFVDHGFGFAVDLSVSDADAVLGIHSVCRDVCEEELQAMGIESIGERRTFFSRVKQFDLQQQQAQQQQDLTAASDADFDGYGSRTASSPHHVDLYASSPRDAPPSRLNHNGYQQASPSPRHPPSMLERDERPHHRATSLHSAHGVLSSSPRNAVTVSGIHGYREKCLVRLGQLDKQLADAWTAARHAARKRRTYSYQEEADWEAAYGAAQASDAARVSSWIGELSELEVACRAGHQVSPSDLPVPFDQKSGSSRSVLLERRVAGKTCPRWWLRSDSSQPSSSRGPSVTQAAVRSGSSAAFPAWW
jgi:hypothetical protein